MFTFCSTAVGSHQRRPCSRSPHSPPPPPPHTTRCRASYSITSDIAGRTRTVATPCRTRRRCTTAGLMPPHRTPRRGVLFLAVSPPFSSPPHPPLLSRLSCACMHTHSICSGGGGGGGGSRSRRSFVRSGARSLPTSSEEAASVLALLCFCWLLGCCFPFLPALVRPTSGQCV